MSGLTTSIEGKTVILSQPYRRTSQTEFIGGNNELEMVVAAWMQVKGHLPHNPLLLGDPGLGKNRLVYEACEKTGKALFILQGHEELSPEDLVCLVRLSDDPEKKIEYLLSPLATAMVTGEVAFLDEIGKVRPKALALLASALDDRRYIDSALLGARILAKPGFRFVAATNTADLDGNTLPDFILHRLRPVIRVGYPPREVLDEIVRTAFDIPSEEIKRLLDCFWDLWTHSGPGQSRRATPREMIQVFGLALRLANFDLENGKRPVCKASRRAPFRLTASRKIAPAVEPRHVEQAFRQIINEEIPR